MANRWWPLALVLALGACTCPPVYHDEQGFVPTSLADPYVLCHDAGAACDQVCARGFNLDVASIDSCQILDIANGGTFVAVTYHEYVCTDDGWDFDWGDGIDDDPCSDGSCDPPPDDPCSDGSCDPPPDDPCSDGSCDPPPDDPPPDDDPPMDPNP